MSQIICLGIVFFIIIVVMLGFVCAENRRIKQVNELNRTAPPGVEYRIRG